MFITRLISGIVLLAIIISTGVIGGPVFGLLCAAISCIGLFEFHRMTGLHKSIYSYVGTGLVLATYGTLYLLGFEYGDAVILLALILYMAIYVCTYPRYESKQVFAAYTGLMYAGIMLSYLMRIRLLDNGNILVWLVFLGSWGSDTCAYCAGVLFGKHKAFPVLSPKKSIEGCVGGVVGAALLSGLYAYAMNRFGYDLNLNVILFAIFGAVASVIAQVGDLAASAMKRNYEIKDYGTLIPGHGGVLDRFDSIIFTAPIMYYLIIFFA